MRVGLRFHELGGDEHPILVSTHAPFQNMGYVQRVSYLTDRDVLALERKRGSPTGHAQAGQLSQRIEQLLGDPIGEVFVVGVAAHVHERQHCDARLRWDVGVGFRGCRRGHFDRRVIRDKDPEPEARDDQQPCDDQKLRSADSLTPLLSVVPSEDEGYEKADAKNGQQDWEKGLRPVQSLLDG